ncbi:MAG: thiamine pyrophosphate-dependent enzyme [Thermodesulfobacteriota bacterium]|nr:thiamine pyrophosphate-dependent enzyme [Thermodesulfobacteriota bacterium]
METFYDTLNIQYGACPLQCNDCEKACVISGHGSESGAAIQTIHMDAPDFHGASTCIQCGEPACQGVCPSGAIKKGESDGVVRIDKERCIGCALCTLACPYGGVFYDVNQGKAFKCDDCDGRFDCVMACKYGVLSVGNPRLVCDCLHNEDLLSLGAFFCPGCTVELTARFTLRVLGKDLIIFGPPGCGVLGVGMAHTATFATLMTNLPSIMTGVKRYYRKKGRDVMCVGFAGDGTTADIGFQPLSAAAERGENLIYICYDNEAYQNTGIQRSSTTPWGAWTSTTQVGQEGHGKRQSAKNVPLLLAMHGIPYAATATVAHLEDYGHKLEKAKAVKDGLAYIHVLCPCPTGWKAQPEESIEISRMAVETNYFPLWEAERGEFRITFPVTNPRPIHEFTRQMGRFSHLSKEELDEFQAIVDDRFAMILRLAG